MNPTGGPYLDSQVSAARPQRRRRRLFVLLLLFIIAAGIAVGILLAFKSSDDDEVDRGENAVVPEEDTIDLNAEIKLPAPATFPGFMLVLSDSPTELYFRWAHHEPNQVDRFRLRVSTDAEMNDIVQSFETPLLHARAENLKNGSLYHFDIQAILKNGSIEFPTSSEFQNLSTIPLSTFYNESVLVTDGLFEYASEISQNSENVTIVTIEPSAGRRLTFGPVSVDLGPPNIGSAVKGAGDGLKKIGEQAGDGLKKISEQAADTFESTMDTVERAAKERLTIAVNEVRGQIRTHKLYNVRDVVVAVDGRVQILLKGIRNPYVFARDAFVEARGRISDKLLDILEANQDNLPGFDKDLPEYNIERKIDVNLGEGNDLSGRLRLSGYGSLCVRILGTQLLKFELETIVMMETDIKFSMDHTSGFRTKSGPITVVPTIPITALFLGMRLGAEMQYDFNIEGSLNFAYRSYRKVYRGMKVELIAGIPQISALNDPKEEKSRTSTDLKANAVVSANVELKAIVEGTIAEIPIVSLTLPLGVHAEYRAETLDVIDYPVHFSVNSLPEEGVSAAIKELKANSQNLGPDDVKLADIKPMEKALVEEGVLSPNSLYLNDSFRVYADMTMLAEVGVDTQKLLTPIIKPISVAFPTAGIQNGKLPKLTNTKKIPLFEVDLLRSPGNRVNNVVAGLGVETASVNVVKGVRISFTDTRWVFPEYPEMRRSLMYEELQKTERGSIASVQSQLLQCVGSDGLTYDEKRIEVIRKVQEENDFDLYRIDNSDFFVVALLPSVSVLEFPVKRKVLDGFGVIIVCKR